MWRFGDLAIYSFGLWSFGALDFAPVKLHSRRAALVAAWATLARGGSHSLILELGKRCGIDPLPPLLGIVARAAFELLEKSHHPRTAKPLAQRLQPQASNVIQCSFRGHGLGASIIGLRFDHAERRCSGLRAGRGGYETTLPPLVCSRCFMS